MRSDADRRGWTNDRLEVAYGEARAVIEAQNTTMADIDDKAMRTVRLTAVLIGLLLTAMRADSSIFHEPWFFVSISFFVLAGIVGITTYDESDLYVGSDGAYLETLANDSAVTPSWDAEMVETYAGMVSENYADLQHNATLLKWTQTTLILGIVTAVLSIAF